MDEVESCQNGAIITTPAAILFGWGRLGGIILNDIEPMKCEIPPDEVHSVFRSRWESHGMVKGLGELQLIGQAETTPSEP